MTGKETAGENGAGPYVKRSRDGSLVLRLSELTWETEFFGRRFGRLAVDMEGIQGFDVDGLNEPLQEVLSFADRNAFALVELELDVSWVHHVHLFESNGFRLVDTKLRFVTWMPKAGMKAPPMENGEVGFASTDMKEEILRLTHRSFTHNPSFKSRFNNERFFKKSDTERYYSAWIENYLGDPNTLFAVMKDEGKVVGYLVYTKAGAHKGKPLYKAALAAVAPEYRGRRTYFSMGSFVYSHLPESGAYLDMTTQLSNLSTIRNLIRAQRNLDNIKLVFYRLGSR